MTAQDLIDRLQSERGAEVLIDGKPIERVDMPYGQPINLKSASRWRRRGVLSWRPSSGR